MYWPNLKSLAFPVREIIAIGVLGKAVGVANPQSWGTGGRRGSGMVAFERALVSACRPSIVTFPLYVTLFRDIAAFVLQHATFSDLTSIVSTNFPHVQLGVAGWRLGDEERRCWANWP